MSGALASALGAVSVAGSALSLLTGQSPVTLDDFEFQAFEVPESVQWGGSQQLAVHDFPGGARVVDAMGAREADISWSGVMLGAGGDDRAARLDGYRQAGDPVTLTWGTFSRTVMVADCQFEQRYQQTRYTIRCTVLPDDDDGTGGVAPSPLAQIGADINSALGFDLTNGLMQVGAGLQAASAVVGAATGVLSPASAASAGAVLGATSATLTAAQLAADAGLAAQSSATGVVGSQAGLLAALGYNYAGANAAGARGYLSRAAQNNGAPPLYGP